MTAPEPTTFPRRLCPALFFAILLVIPGGVLRANIPGGGTGTGANVTLTSTGTTATMSNGIVSIIMTKSSGQITTINYTFNNTGSSQTLNLLSGNSNGGKLYWEHSNNQGMVFTYSVVADSATNGGDYAEVSLYSTTQANMPFEVHYSMRRGSPGFYVTAIWMHDSSNGAFGMGECRNNIYAGSIFNWMSVDATRNKLMPVTGGSSVGVPTAPVECSLWVSGIYQGQYEDKYKYSARFGDQRVWGWSSVGAGGRNVGLWDVSATAEYYNGGPMKAELMEHMGTTILNMFNGSHYGQGTDGDFAAGEVWSKVCGPYFVYCNNVSSSITNPVQASQALYADALAQGQAEAGAWPYSWFSNPHYASAANRGTVAGRIVINDAYNPNASAANLWVGVIQQPSTLNGLYDFQHWMKPYQFWVHSDASGRFTIPNVIAGTNYTLYAFGPGAAGTFMSQAQTGGSPAISVDIPSSPFSVTVNGGATTSLGDVTWTPTRIGPTVFQIGYPDRTGGKFRHGEDWWVGDIGPSPGSPSPVWTKFMEYPFDFPTGPSYTVGTSRWTTDWNFIQPAVYGATGNWSASTSKINFNLAAAPASGAQGSLYLALASDYQGPLVIQVNGTNIAGGTGYFPAYSGSSFGSNAAIREGIAACYSDKRITFAGSLLKAGMNTITITMRKGDYFANHAMYDYLRLELTGYVPPAPSSVSGFPGNNSALVTWPAVPGATSYNVLRSTVSGSGYAQIASGVAGPVCGSGVTNATYVDSSAANGTTYYYVVQSANPLGASANSSPSAGVTPSASAATSAPAAPTGLTTAAGDHSVWLSWTASSGANLYTVKRSTLVANGGGTYNNLGTITLANNVTGTSYVDTSPTNGTIHAYTVSATNAAGRSADSTASANTTPVAPAPAAPATFTATALQGASAGTITLDWSAVSGAGGYVIQSATSSGGPYAFEDSVSSLTRSYGGLNANTTYYYQVATTNSGGTSAFVTASAITPPAAPASLTATAGSSKVTLSWTASPGATSYVIGRSTTSGGSYTTLASAATGTGFTDTTALNGVTYYYVVAATGAGGTGANSSEASATPIGTTNLVWTGAGSTAWDTTTSNWLNGGAATVYSDGAAVVFDDSATTTTVAIGAPVSPQDITFNNVTKNYTLGGSAIAGPTGIIKNGTGTVTLNNANSLSGLVVVNAGTLALGSGTLGTSSLQLGNGATFRMGSGGSNFPGNDIQIPAETGATLSSANLANGYGGTISGPSSATLTLAGPVSFGKSGSAQLSGFSGLVLISAGSQLRFSSTSGANGNGGADATFQVDGLLNSRNAAGAGGIVLGGLSGSGSVQGQTNTIAGTDTYFVGSNNLDTTFSGIIANGGNGITALTKNGTGTLTLSGASTYTGATLVGAGRLRITGSVSGSSALTVSSGATLDLAGGTLSVSGAITNNGTVRLSGSPSLSSTGTFTNNGVLDLINGPASLPANFVNNGTVLDSSSVQVKQASVSGADVVVTVQGQAGHHYQLQRSDSLPAGTWTNVGASQAGAGATLTFTDAGGASAARAFYRVVITP
jgi:rhamnogalacturonan endolyase